MENKSRSINYNEFLFFYRYQLPTIRKRYFQKRFVHPLNNYDRDVTMLE